MKEEINMLKQKGNILIILMGIVAFVVLAVAIIYKNKIESLNNAVDEITTSAQNATSKTTVPEVKSKQDLIDLSLELDKVNLDDIDANLKANDSESQGF